MKSRKLFVAFTIVQLIIITVFTAINCAAMELDQNQITDSDRDYFATILTPEKVDKLQQIGNYQYTRSKLTCNQQVDAANDILRVLEELIPIFRNASISNELSNYAKKYSASTADDFVNLQKVLVTGLPEMKSACKNGEIDRREIEFYNQMIKWFTNSDICNSCKQYALGSSERNIAGLKEYQVIFTNDKDKLKAIDHKFRVEVWNKTNELSGK